MENFLSRLNRNPYAPIDAASITRVDELGNGYDDFGQLIAPKFQAPEQSWGETALGVATAPARMTMGLVESLSPYGADGWQIPPIVNEGVNALTAVGDAYTGKMPEDEINSRALGMAGFMMGGGGLAARPAGGTGMFAGRLAKTADQEALARAERLAAEGADRRAIWDQTGWFQGPDQKWRFEIDDSKAYADVAEGISDGWKPSERWPLGHVLGHRDAFAAYPSLDDAGIQYRQFPQNYKDAIGSYAQNGDQIVLNSSHRNFGDDKAALSAILHEGQHRIQSTEGFARGGNRGVFTPEEIAAERARIGAVPEDKTGWTSVGTAAGDAPDTDVALGLYKRLAGETEARNVQTRMNMTPEQRRATPPWETQDIPFEDQIVRLYSNSDSRPAIAASGLDMSQEARLARARDMGFDTDRVLYHGTRANEPFAEFDPARVGGNSGNQGFYGRGYYATPDEAYAEDMLYGGNGHVRQLFARSEKPFVIDYQNFDDAVRRAAEIYPDAPLGEGGFYDPKHIAGWTEALKRNGYDAVDVRTLEGDLDSHGSEFVALYPNRYRDVNAAFDPIMRDSANLLAANADSRPALLAGMAGQEGKPIRAYHGTSSKIIGPLKDVTQSINSTTFGDMDTVRHGPFLSENRDFSKEYGNNIIEADVRAQNIADVMGVRSDFVDSIDPFENRDLWLQAKYAQQPWQLFEGDKGQAFKDWLRANGYDAARFSEEVPTASGGYVEGNTIVPLQRGTVFNANTGEILYANADSKPALLAGAIGGEQPEDILRLLGYR